MADGALLDVRLTPRGGRDQIDGVGTLSDGRRVALARVRAVPEKGAANAALELLVAKSLDWPRSAVSVVAGHTARLKTVRLVGDAVELARRLEALALKG
ncbi:DUF167 family protein [Kaistia dalseonensis]|uniref:UPF0235 protein QO014_003089 n=1 Tax=Kaistia dalseonensis TaxID=410840 RepID=A0ABU0H8Q0_9HYPH|nr:DUF167 family protein [Kaistia dalseonensis]MCX5496089.1 DUF167 family protein [Kaistia dalseonensis]MDQ0438694.1 uncharacterized protein YggU (UPF0235/DUF167 family) [Kaistia dalseonensis]